MYYVRKLIIINLDYHALYGAEEALGELGVIPLAAASRLFLFRTNS